jgi:xanthine dehydrogenase accessory factor
MSKNITRFCENFLEYKKRNTPLVVVTLVSLRGSAPQDLGAKVIITSEGLVYGTIGGGKIEAHCIEFAKNEILLNPESELKVCHTWNLQKDIGMTCGGEVSMFFEKEDHASAWNIAIFGAGHVSQELTRALLRLECNLFVIDNRQEWLDKLPTGVNLKTILFKDMKVALKELPANTFIVSMTMGHSYDVPILFEALKKYNFPFIGVIGSVSKRNALESELKKLGLNSDHLNKMVCPIGEKVGTNDPAEIAISVIAQLLSVRDL